jgi:hypothetical protein
MANGQQEIYIKRIEGGIRAIKGGRKTPKTAEVGKWLNKLKPLNLPMYEDKLTEYTTVVRDYNKDIQFS